LRVSWWHGLIRGFVGERIGRPHRQACALAVRGVGGSPWLALTPVLLTGSVATANWLQPAGMATHCASELASAGQGSPDFLAGVPTLFASLPGATDARRASLGGDALDERSGRPYRRAYALAVRGVGGSPRLALTPVLLTGSVATANWLQPAGMATHCANVLMSAVSGNPDSLADGPTLFASLSGGCGDRPEFIRGCHRVGRLSRR